MPTTTELPAPVTTSAMTVGGGLLFFVAPQDVKAVRRFVDRAVNTLEPVSWPAWLKDLDAVLDRCVTEASL